MIDVVNRDGGVALALTLGTTPWLSSKISNDTACEQAAAAFPDMAQRFARTWLPLYLGVSASERGKTSY